MNFTMEQLEQVQTRLEGRMRRARAEQETLSSRLAQMVILHEMGEVSVGEIEEARREFAVCQSAFDEIPPALSMLKIWIEHARLRGQQEQRIQEARETLAAYFKARDEMIKNPKLSALPIESGRLNGLASQLDRDVRNGRLPAHATSFDAEYRALIAACQEFLGKPREQAFDFHVLNHPSELVSP